MQDRIEANAPLRERELDRFDRLTLLIERANETCQNTDKALFWLQTPKRSMGGATPLEYSARERVFLEVSSQLNRIAHGIYA